MSIDVSVQRLVVDQERVFELDVCFSSPRRRVALYGPSGAGKSLTLQAIAGLMHPDAGRIVVNGRVLFDSACGIDVPARARRLAYLFQDYALFPQLTVAQNICFGLSRSWLNPSRRDMPPAARRWVEAFELESLCASLPAQISGGQRQRVALARALAAEPEALLLDEPFAALDGALRRKLRQELMMLQRELDIPMILITHDREDVAALAEEVFELDEGRVVSGATA